MCRIVGIWDTNRAKEGIRPEPEETGRWLDHRGLGRKHLLKSILYC